MILCTMMINDNMDDNHIHVLSKNTLIATLAHGMHLKAAK